jgi:hypothetical protein
MQTWAAMKGNVVYNTPSTMVQFRGLAPRASQQDADNKRPNGRIGYRKSAQGLRASEQGAWQGHKTTQRESVDPMGRCVRSFHRL